MNTWEPLTQSELEKIIEFQLVDCTLEQQKVFEKYRVPLHLAPVERYGVIEEVFIVARRGNEVLYYEAVEEGFNFSPIGEDGKILEHWCNQDELKVALWHWIDDQKYVRLCPAEPLPE